MIDLFQMEEAMLKTMEPWDQHELARVHFLMEREAERPARTVRSRVAGLIVSLGLKLDPEALTVAPRRVPLEVANVHD